MQHTRGGARRPETLAREGGSSEDDALVLLAAGALHRRLRARGPQLEGRLVLANGQVRTIYATLLSKRSEILIPPPSLVAEVWSKPGPNSSSTRIWCRRRAEVGRLSTNRAKVWSSSRVWPIPGVMLAEVAQHRLTFGRVRAPKLAEIRAKFGRHRPTLVRFRPDVAPIWANIGLNSKKLHGPRSGALFVQHSVVVR